MITNACLSLLRPFKPVTFGSTPNTYQGFTFNSLINQLPGHIVFISGPSGAGKTSILDRVFRDSEISHRLTSLPIVTTRERRQHETEGKDIHTWSEKDFRENKGTLFMWARVHDNLYGFKMAELIQKLHDGLVSILTMSAPFALNMAKLYPGKITTIFIAPEEPTREKLLKRLSTRFTESDAHIATRMASVDSEMSLKDECDYVVYSRDGKLDEAAKEVKEILLEATDRQLDQVA